MKLIPKVITKLTKQKKDSDDAADSESDNEANQAKDVDDLHYKKCLRPQRQLLNKIGDMKT